MVAHLWVGGAARIWHPAPFGSLGDRPTAPSHYAPALILEENLQLSPSAPTKCRREWFGDQAPIFSIHKSKASVIEGIGAIS